MKILEALSYVALLAVSSLGVYRLWQFRPTNTHPSTTASISTAAAVPTSVAGKIPVDLTSRKKWIVLALSTQCHFCQESAPFHADLVQMLRKSADTGLVAVFPQNRQEVEQYEVKYKVNFPNIVTDISPTQLEVRGTPTLLVVDQQGKVLKSWRGLLPEGGQKEVRTELGLKN
jgi:hypothetical protein